MAAPFLIVGLGNPGPKYSATRHNAGFWFVDRLAALEERTFRNQVKLNAELARVECSGHDCLLAKPTTFMNHSGQAVRAVLDYYGIGFERLLVAYDELDLPPGAARLKLGGGHGGHNGLRDIFRHLPEHGFLRLRIGIGHPGHKDLVTPYVLSRPGAGQKELMHQAIERSIDALPKLLDGDLSGAMKQLHTAADSGL